MGLRTYTPPNRVETLMSPYKPFTLDNNLLVRIHRGVIGILNMVVYLGMAMTRGMSRLVSRAKGRFGSMGMRADEPRSQEPYSTKDYPLRVDRWVKRIIIIIRDSESRMKARREATVDIVDEEIQCDTLSNEKSHLHDLSRGLECSLRDVFFLSLTKSFFLIPSRSLSYATPVCGSIFIKIFDLMVHAFMVVVSIGPASIVIAYLSRPLVP